MLHQIITNSKQACRVLPRQFGATSYYNELKAVVPNSAEASSVLHRIITKSKQACGVLPRLLKRWRCAHLIQVVELWDTALADGERPSKGSEVSVARWNRTR